MALILQDRVKEVSNSSGTGSITLAGAYTGYRTFNSCVANGSTVYYTIHNTTAPNDGEWEVGIGTFTAPATLSRDTVLSSSNGGSKTVFSAASDLEVFITQPAEEAVYLNQASGLVEVGGNGTNTVSFTNINTTNLTATTVTLTAGTISTNASNTTDIVNKQYVDGIVAAGVHYHAPVLVESPTALIATYNQPGGAGNGVGATLTNSGSNVALSIDGVSLSNTARVLVYTQSNAVQNGVYTVTNPGAPDAPGPGAAWVLTRATDADTYVVASSAGLSEGSTFFVQSGNTGAGEVYTCNTQGTITFGTTDITFAQIGSAQIYSAGTGLSLTNTTFSISNTAVTAAQYGNDGAVGQFTVNAQGQITNAANVSINASSISVGTLANGRTTAASANGASTIVLRDANGSFAGNVITATTSNATTFNGTTGAFTNVSGNGVALTAINASNVTSGTLANARTTASDANGASTIVSRDANGSFGANIVTATFSGNGASISAINASNISSGTIANARTTAASANGASTIVQRDSGGNFSANTVTAAVIGDLSGGSNINASNIASGTIANARTTASSSNGASTIVLRGASGEFAAGAITGTSFSGNGSALTAINATAITSGTLDNARTNATSANGASTLVVRDANGSFAGNVITGTTGTFTNISGNGTSLTAINASNVTSGTLDNARTTAASANGASTIVARDSSGNFTANAGTFTSVSGNGSALTAINASNVSTGTIANARTTAATANGASTIVLRGTSGEFSAGAITGASFTGDGAAISNTNASNLSAGTVANARTTGASANGASTLVLRDANGSFAGNVITGTTGTFTNISGNGSSLTAINASNISSGTIANARTTAASANGASTIVARDANGSFTANVVNVTTLSGGAVSGNGAGLTAINASNISSGTIANARTTASSSNSASTLVSRDANGSFGVNSITGTGAAFSPGTSAWATGAAFISSGSFGGGHSVVDGSAGFAIYAQDSGANLIIGSGATSGGTTERFRLNNAGTVTATTFSGSGASLTSINASNISSGTVATARISGSYTGITGVGTLTAGTWNATTIAQANGGTGFTTGYRLFQSEFTTSINANTNRTVGAYGSYGFGATNTPTNSGILYSFTGGTDGSGDGGQFWQDYSTDVLYLRKRWGGSYGSWTQFVTTAGTGASGTWSINVTGSAGSATTATTATNLSGGTVSATTVQATGGFTATSAAPFYTNATTVSSNYTVPTSFNAMSAGPITINTGVTVTVSTGSSWVVV
jgi:hypothetical protein